MTDAPKISSQKKHNNWTFYVFARSSDPFVMIPYTRKLVSSLMNSARIMGLKEYDKMFLWALTKASDAEKILAENPRNWGYAVKECEQIMDEIDFLLDDLRFATPREDSFKYPGKDVK